MRAGCDPRHLCEGKHAGRAAGMCQGWPMRIRLVAAALLVASGTAAAWVAQPDREPTEVAVGSLKPRGERTLVPARGLPAGWQGVRDPDTGVVAEIYGSFVPAPGA